MKYISPLFILILILFSAKANGQLKVEKYRNYMLAGFNVLVQDSAFTVDSTLTKKGIELLENKLQEVVELPLSQVVQDSLKAVPIFMDWNTTTGAAVYHPGRQWLIDNGYIPQKAKCVEISNIKNFINWTKQNQPMMVLHELAHARHHRVFNFNSSVVTEAFANVRANGLYTNVSYHKGNGNYETVDKAYALNNEMEYLAEMTEAYFGTNDFYPFTRNELKEYDPIGYQAVEAIWGTTSSSVAFPLSRPSVFAYPNPALEQISIEHGGNETATLEIIALDGRFVKAMDGHKSGSPIDIRDLKSGTYLLMVFKNRWHSPILLVKH